MMGAADVVFVSTAPPSLWTVVVAAMLMVQFEVDPDFGAPKITDGLALLAPFGFKVAVLAFAPGVNVHL